VNRYIFICLSLALISAALFVADTNGVFDKSKHPIAFISESTHTVRRLPNNELTWDRAREGTPLELGDTISTGYRAQVKIVFKAGGLLTLDEGSMVVLSGDLEQLQLNFVTGGAHLQVTQEAKTKIKVVQPVTKVTSSARKIKAPVEVTSLEEEAFLNLTPQESSPKKIEFKEALPGVVQKNSIDPADNISGQSFEIEKAAKVRWSTDQSREEYFYGTSKATVKVSWILEDGVAQKDSYFKITFTGEDSDSRVIAKTKNLSLEEALPNDGVYQAQVELLSANGIVLSTSPMKEVAVKMAPLLPPPKLNFLTPCRPTVL